MSKARELHDQGEKGQGGFTLIEALVAMTVLAIAAVGLLSATESHLQRTNALEDRIVARWVAENVLAELRLNRRDIARTKTMLARSWDIQILREKTSDADLEKVTVKVNAASGQSNGTTSTLFELVSFIDIADNRLKGGS